MKHRCVLCRPLSGRLIHLQYPIPRTSKKQKKTRTSPSGRRRAEQRPKLDFDRARILRKSLRVFTLYVLGGRPARIRWSLPVRPAVRGSPIDTSVCPPYEMPSGAKLVRSPFPRWVAAYWKSRGSIRIKLLYYCVI